MSWADLFERAEPHRADVETIREALAARRSDGAAEKTDPEEDRDA